MGDQFWNIAGHLFGIGQFLLFPALALYCWYLWLGGHTRPRRRWGEGDNWRPGQPATGTWFYDRDVHWLVRGGAIFFTAASALLIYVAMDNNAVGLRCLVSLDPSGVGACQRPITH
jgi:hypothetical protein